MPIRLHREIPDGATVKQVTVKREPTGRWYAVVGIEADDETPPKPDCPEEYVGIDVGILQYVHDTDGHAVGSLDLSAEQDRLEHEQRVLSRRQHGSANYEKQRRKVARRHADIKRKRRDFLHKLSNYYATEYDLVAVENLNVLGMMQFDSNSHNRVSAAWGTFLRMLAYKCEREGTHFIPVRPHGTTKECAQCGVEPDKPLWVREHSCPACGFEADRDENAAWNVLARGVKRYNDPEDDAVGRGTAESTPAETVVPTSIAPMAVDANHVAETGSPVLNERAARRAK